jgi:hypothetical protein
MLIRQHDSPPQFWPNLTSIHYFHDAISWYEATSVAFVEKKHKSLNSPELQKIERYWALLKRNVQKRPTAASNINFFKREVNRTVKTIDQKVLQTLTGGLKEKVCQFGRGDKI